MDILSVSALNRYVRALLEENHVLSDIAIRGEISNYVRNAKTGHCYFSLKDQKASVKCVLFNQDAQLLRFAPASGLQVVARGRVSLYEPGGQYQMIAEFLFPDGEGAWQAAYEKLRERLDSEGLFSPAHKKELPERPLKIGVITSKTGAVLQDIINVTQRRNPFATLVLAAATVQGENAVAEISAAIAALDAMEDVKVIIIARGGGSAEDLWVFNDERLARTAFACATPIVSAIGHETDTTILDDVSDMRAPTPSVAAELCTPDISSYFENILQEYSKLANNIQFAAKAWYNQLVQVHGRALAEGARRTLATRHDALGQMQKDMLQQRRNLLAALALMRCWRGVTRWRTRTGGLFHRCARCARAMISR